MSKIKKINANQFRACQQDPEHCVVDVRDWPEYSAGSEASCCLPLSAINAETVAEFVRERNLTPDQTVVLLCARGMRAQQAAEKLSTLLPNPIAVVDGGHAALNETAPAVISIERQVRIAAGSLVLTGVIASIFYPAAIILSGLIGAGLVFAGITDWCGLGLLMMKMPWNKTA